MRRVRAAARQLIPFRTRVHRLSHYIRHPYLSHSEHISALARKMGLCAAFRLPVESLEASNLNYQRMNFPVGLYRAFLNFRPTWEFH